MNTRTGLVVLVVTVLLVPTVTLAQDSHWVARGRVVDVSPNDSSSAIAGTDGTTVTVDSDVIPEVDITYMLNANWAPISLLEPRSTTWRRRMACWTR